MHLQSSLNILPAAHRNLSLVCIVKKKSPPGLLFTSNRPFYSSQRHIGNAAALT